MSIIHANNFATTLSAAITSTGATSMTLASVTGAPTIGSGVSCYFTITDGTNYEIVTAGTAPSGTTYSGLTRGAQGTTARTWSIGAIVQINSTKDSFDRKLDAPASITVNQLYAGPASANGLTQQISGGGAGNYLQWNSGALPSWTAGNGIIALSSSVDACIPYTNGTNFSLLTPASSATRYLANTGTNNRPAWAQVNMSNGVTGTLPIANGGTNVTSVTTAPTASSFAGWDANSNLSANNILTGYATTATSAGTRTLTVASARAQVYTGSTTHTQVMPVVSTLAQGTVFVTTNYSSGVVTVQSSGANTIQAMAANTTLILQSNATSGTGASVWDVVAYIPAASDITGTGSLVRATAPTIGLVNATGLPISTGVSGLGTGIATFLATPSSANLASAITDESGTGALIFAGGNIGAATATSINFGQSTLDFYEEGTYTPTFTFSTVGDLSVAYTTQSGLYRRIGKAMFFRQRVAFTPTFTTSSGTARFGALPYAVNSGSGGGGATISLGNNNLTFPAGVTYIIASPAASNTYSSITGVGSAAGTTLGVAHFVSGTAFDVTIVGTYMI